jgi:hypothetical protein
MEPEMLPITPNSHISEDVIATNVTLLSSISVNDQEEDFSETESSLQD